MTTTSRSRAPATAALLAASAAGWIALAAGVVPAHQHTAPTSSTDSMSSMQHGPSAASLAAFGAGWAVMVIAMMAPLLIAPVRHIRSSSLASRRARSVALFLAGYAGVWITAGVVAAAVALSQVRPVVALVVAAGVLLWQVSPAKQQCLNRLHAHPPLSAFGTAADRDARRFGVAHGGWCAASCGPVMLLPFLVPDGHLLAVVGAIWVAAERLDRPTAPSWRVRGVSSAFRLVDARFGVHLRPMRSSAAGRHTAAVVRPPNEFPAPT